MVQVADGTTSGNSSPKIEAIDSRVFYDLVKSACLPQSKTFYGKLFGWEFRPVKGTDLVADPTGHPVGIYSRTAIPSPGPTGE